MTPGEVAARWLGGFTVYLFAVFVISRGALLVAMKLPGGLWRFALADGVAAAVFGWIMWAGDPDTVSLWSLGLAAGAVFSWDAHKHRQRQTSADVSQREVEAAINAMGRSRAKASRSDLGASDSTLDDGYKIYPFCAEEIRAKAIKCRYCQSSLPE